jgi:hypothetical protein
LHDDGVDDVFGVHPVRQVGNQFADHLKVLKMITLTNDSIISDHIQGLGLELEGVRTSNEMLKNILKT